MTREGLIEVMARAIEPNMPVQVKYWQEGKIQHAKAVFPGDPEYVSPVPAAIAALAAIEAAGVRLVPSEATAEMVNGAVSRRFKSYLTKSDDMYADIYAAMLAASPYAPQKDTKE